MAEKRVIEDPEYVQGQIAALRSVLIGIAGLISTPAEFGAILQQRFELLRTGTIPMPVSDLWFAGIDHEAAFWERLTRGQDKR